MSRNAEAQLAWKALSRFLRCCARLAGVPWSDQLHQEIIAAIGAAIRSHRPTQSCVGPFFLEAEDPQNHRNSVPRGTTHHI
jgi:hypothetical protein